MELQFQDKKVYYDKVPSVENVLEKIYLWLGKSYYSHIVADGIEIYEELNQFLEKSISRVQKIEVIGRTEEEYIFDFLVSTNNYLKGAIPEISNLTNGFYSNPNMQTWEQFNNLLEGIQWIDQVFDSISKLESKPINWNSYLEISDIISGEVKNLAKAIEVADYILIADTLQYELLPGFELLQKKINMTIDVKGNVCNAN
ncbi:hypothetical protein SAMN05443252_102355 [Bacillus sp. OV322]|uniref:hypothetical protein n=1 Tax=Bacillus sp. OV322 TaxID=1882764 RepID=UPI0008E43CE1|nr:hypothetical protein [Bacillus sp. OV322]SFC24117.1 hypothetical protein SAMN05443252_102355 [Bacillus sp. OV322]